MMPELRGTCGEDIKGAPLQRSQVLTAELQLFKRWIV